MLPPEIDSIIFLNKIISKLNALQISHMYVSDSNRNGHHTVTQVWLCPVGITLKLSGQPTFGTILSVDTQTMGVFLFCSLKVCITSL